MAWITRTDADGKRVHSSEAVRHVLPLLVLQTGFPFGVEPKIDALMMRFVEAASITEDMSAQAIGMATALYYQRHPVDPRLLADLRESAGSVFLAELDASAAKHVVRHAAVPTSALFALAPPGRTDRVRR